MAFRWIPHKDKVAAFNECIEIKNVKEVAKKYNISPDTLTEYCNCVIDEADEILTKKKPGRKSKTTNKKDISKGNVISITIKKDSTTSCPSCTSIDIVNNGTYPAKNYFFMLICMLAPYLKIDINYEVQKYMCKSCGKSFKDKTQSENLHFKRMVQLSATKLILILRFKLGVSVRGISSITNEVYGVFYSNGYIDKVCKIAAQNASKQMEKINYCNQKKADVLMFDETFPKAKGKGCINLGVATCENGLIRMVKTVDTNAKAKELDKLFDLLITEKYKPTVFISDYELSYPKAILKQISEIEILKDTVHTVRQLSRDCKSAINKVILHCKQSTKLGKCNSQKMLKLKKRLMLKQLNKVMYRLFKGFKPNKCAVGTIYIEGSLEELKELCSILPSLKPLYKKISKFIKKYIEQWNAAMELYAKNHIPLTSNIIESKNSIFKAFSKKAKSYSDLNIEDFFNCVALMENFDIKTRGRNKGTNAMMRAGIDLNEFGANNFFDAVGLIPEIDVDINSNYFNLGLNHTMRDKSNVTVVDLKDQCA